MNASCRCTLLCCVALLALAPFGTAQAQTGHFGKFAIEGPPSAGLAGDFKRGSRFELTQPGVLIMLNALIDGQGGPTSGYQDVSMEVYLDANGVPGVKIAESDPLRVYAQTGGDWQHFYIPAVPLAPGFYWLVIHSAGTASGSTPGIVRDYGGGSINSWYGNADTFSDGGTSPFGTGSTGTGSLTVYAEYMPTYMITVAGRNTVAMTPSAGLSSNFKRGARITLGTAGRLSRLSAYLDGKGGGTGAQKLRYALYRDAGGVPGAKVTESNEVSVKAGQAASWVTAEAPNIVLDAGNYWLTIHSGDTAGIARDFGDGAANWYGNADTYADGASPTFGSGNSGTGTISAAAIVIPGTMPLKTLGRTSIATIPSGGLSANRSRGATFGAYQVDNRGIVTALWAYLDGRGGTSGSQQLRMALYLDDQYKDTPVWKLYQTEVVTISAGTSPRWVRFPLKAPLAIGAAGAYWLMLQSGDTAGVVRDYGDGRANWVSVPDTFADGSAPAIDWFYDPNFSRGTVEMSVYLEYAVSEPPAQ
jgi:hypothetical protein